MAAKRIRDLSELKKVKLKKLAKQERKKAQAKASSTAVQSAAEAAEEMGKLSGDELFARAMTGVDPMDDEKGRQVAPAAPTPAPPPARPRDEEAEALRSFLSGAVEFDLSLTEEYMHGRVKGMDAKIFRQLRAGSLSPEAHLDLHGLNVEQAHASLLFFLREAWMNSHRCVLVIHGRGKNSPGGQGVIKRELQHWLTRDPLKRVVLAFCTAQPRHGGAGAVYILLRRDKKSQGKVIWDRMPLFDEGP